MEAAAWTPPDDVLTRPAPPPDVTLTYGPEPDHVADLRLPPSPAGPLVIFLHGGFWRVKFDRTHTGPMATALAAAGYTVCVPEFRRAGQPGGGWPGTLDDVAAAVDSLPGLVRAAVRPRAVADGPALLAGHSAGGQLALWAAARHRLPPDSPWRLAVSPARGVVALGAVTCLADCHDRNLGDGAAAGFTGGSPGRYPDRYHAADPVGLLPLGCPVRLVHGTLDEVVPLDMSETYLARARQAGDDVVLAAPAGASHVDVIDPLSPAWPEVMAAFAALAPLPPAAASS